MPHDKTTYLVRDFSAADRGKVFVERQMPGIGRIVMVNRDVHERALAAANRRLREIMTKDFG